MVGSVHVFASSGDGWRHRTVLTAADASDRAWFGGSVAASSDGSTLLVGGRGSAYVFDRNDGSWSQTTKFTPSTSRAPDAFGEQIALSDDGNTALLGNVELGEVRVGGGAVFERNGDDWVRETTLSATDGDTFDLLGSSVALSGDGTTAIVGARADEDPNGEGAGSVYVFEADDGGWTQRAKLAADDGDSRDNFGKSVAVSRDGTTVLVGANWDEDPNGSQAGATYVFASDGSGWRQLVKLAPDDGDRADTFGTSVTLDGEGRTAVVGAPMDEDPNGLSAGSAYLFRQTADGWGQRSKLVAANGDSGDGFGRKIAIASDGSTALVGAEHNEGPNNEIDRAGSAYVFDLPS